MPAQSRLITGLAPALNLAHPGHRPPAPRLHTLLQGVWQKPVYTAADVSDIPGVGEEVGLALHLSGAAAAVAGAAAASAAQSSDYSCCRAVHALQTNTAIICRRAVCWERCSSCPSLLPQLG